MLNTHRKETDVRTRMLRGGGFLLFYRRSFGALCKFIQVIPYYGTIQAGAENGKETSPV